MDDILELNVGGVVMTVKRSTLLQVPEGSLLHSMFSGRWEAGHCRDAQGRIFLDFSPKSFAIILDYLRSVSISNKPASEPWVPQKHLSAYSTLVEYLGLSYYLHGCLAPRQLDFEPGQPTENGCNLVGGTSLSKHSLGNRVAVWKCIVEQDGDLCLRLGIAIKVDSQIIKGPTWQFQNRLHCSSTNLHEDIDLPPGVEVLIFKYMRQRLQMHISSRGVTLEADVPTSIDPDTLHVYVQHFATGPNAGAVEVCSATVSETALIGTNVSKWLPTSGTFQRLPRLIVEQY